MGGHVFVRPFSSALRQAVLAVRPAPFPTATTRGLHRSAATVRPRRPLVNTQRIAFSHGLRCYESTVKQPVGRPLTDREEDKTEDLADADKIAMRKALSPAYQLWFTCKRCLERSRHTVSKQSYHHGTCVVQCPQCKSQHLISDHLKIFSDTNLTMEDIAKEHGEKLRKGRLGADGDIEFYDNESAEQDGAPPSEGVT